MNRILKSTLFIFMGLLSLNLFAQDGYWQQKVDDWVVESTDAGGETEFLVVLQEQADLRVVYGLTSKHTKGTAVYEQLKEVSQRSQMPVIADLQNAGVPYRPYWISNMIWVRGDGNLVEMLASRSDVARIHANPWTKLATRRDLISTSTPRCKAGS